MGCYAGSLGVLDPTLLPTRLCCNCKVSTQKKTSNGSPGPCKGSGNPEAIFLDLGQRIGRHDGNGGSQESGDNGTQNGPAALGGASCCPSSRAWAPRADAGGR